MMYFIQAKVKRKVFGISSEFEDTVTKLVNAPNVNMAKEKYEYNVSRMFNKEQPERITFEYILIADEI
jgi:hypothetical protein